MGTVTDVRIARRTGFCYGVREAIDAARISASEGKTTHTLGQVVHNEGVISQLKQEGIRSVKELDEVNEGAAVVIRAHGVTPETMERAESKGLDVIDGTCSWVTQEQKELARLVEEGYTSTEQLAVSGGSAGGLLVGAAMTMRPDVFGPLEGAGL